MFSCFLHCDNFCVNQCYLGFNTAKTRTQVHSFGSNIYNIKLIYNTKWSTVYMTTNNNTTYKIIYYIVTAITFRRSYFVPVYVQYSIIHNNQYDRCDHCPMLLSISKLMACCSSPYGYVWLYQLSCKNIQIDVCGLCKMIHNDTNFCCSATWHDMDTLENLCIVIANNVEMKHPCLFQSSIVNFCDIERITT